MLFWRKSKTSENERCEKAKKAAQKIEGPLWGYMVTQRGVAVDVLQRLRRVERAGTVGGETATLVRIFDPAAVKRAGVKIDSYEGLDARRWLILYGGYYRGPEMADIRVMRAVYDKEKAPR